MPNDPIKAALAAATRGFCDAMTGGGCECAQGERHPGCDMDSCAASAVAAFLRALPDRFQARLPAHTNINRRDPNMLHQLAAAVELAAQEARDGE